MTRIKILPESVKNRIAAGEVVEGPFSVIKELIENSIDAKSTEIKVEVFDSGLKKIVVKDNGIGIYKEDLPLAITNYATSKIIEINDIERLTSYGFRGEALSSISSISRLSILTRSRDEEFGARLYSINNQTELSDYAGPAGTTIIVENLFYNIPARKKFLKGKGPELRRIREVFIKIALANPQISFSLNVDGKRQVTLENVEGLDARIEQIYGKTILENLYFGRLNDLSAEIRGFLSKPDFLKSSRSMQILYVNNRLVEYRPFGFLLSKAYEAIAAKGCYPVAFIFITIDPELIDINIHPAKREVKFFDQRYIDSLILHLPEKLLGEQVHHIRSDLLSAKDNHIEDLGHVMVPKNKKDVKTSIDIEQHLRSEDNDIPNSICAQEENNAMSSNYSFRSLISDTANLFQEIEKQNDIKSLGVIFNTYIIVEEDDSINFIDFHAAHERFIYDALMDKDSKLETQILVFPQIIELSVEDYQILLERMDYFSQIAFDIDIFSDTSIIVRGIPDILEGLDIEDFFMDVIESLKTNRNHITDVKKIVAEKTACYSAKRSKDRLSEDDARMISREALNGKHELRCPHGRPYIYKLEKKDIEGLFKRS